MLEQTGHGWQIIHGTGPACLISCAKKVKPERSTGQTTFADASHVFIIGGLLKNPLIKYLFNFFNKRFFNN